MKKENYLLQMGILFAILIISGLIFRNFYYHDIVNSDKIKFITDHNDDQAYHPKVLYFENGWNGYKYWVAFTPYKHADATMENPNINASNDLVKWEVPDGLTNPLDRPDHPDKIHYNSDTHLVYNNDLDQLEVFWRYVNDKDNEVTIFKSISKDGINWSDKEVFIKSDNRKKQDFLSPAIIYENGKYLIWYVAKKQVYYMEKEGEILTEPVKLNIKYEEELYSWHIDVIKNNDKYDMVMVSYEDINNRRNMKIYYTSSKDNVNWDTAKLILEPSNTRDAWDNSGLYRPALMYKDGTYYVFYSAHDDVYNVGIGLMCGKDIFNLKSCTGKK